MRDDVRGRVDTLVAAGRVAEARSVARDALDADGPDAGLFLALARAHMSEDDDDHDDEAEQVFREGLDSFPDDVGLLGGYAELCVRTDALDRPGRHARGPALLARLREVAPYAPEVRRAEAAGSSVSTHTRSGASARRVQSFDAARAFAGAATPQAAAAQCARWADSAPSDPRLAVLAETTGALAAPGRTGSRLLLRRGLEYRFAVSAAVAVLVALRITVAPAVPYGVPIALGLLAGLPLLRLRSRLRAARERADARLATAVPDGEAVAGSDAFGPPELPPVPRATPREYVFAGGGLALLVMVGGAAYASSLAYPRYDIVTHESYLGLEGHVLREEYGPFTAIPDDKRGQSTVQVYVPEGAAPDTPAEYLVAVTTGDFHEMRESYLGDGTDLMGVDTQGAGSIHDIWRAEGGPHGSWMRCLRYTETASGTLRGMCLWADKGSLGMVLFTAEDKNRAAIEETARAVGADFLQPTED
ncbi:hypothetical protein ACIRQY_32210 [Streptomyces sp. NPDC101490]|uniref:hypothetical protein n=1 Tax=Streptomyces sp. NPDC101490 TaxID=3366143 RepID=UPI00380688F9